MYAAVGLHLPEVLALVVRSGRQGETQFITQRNF